MYFQSLFYPISVRVRSIGVRIDCTYEHKYSTVLTKYLLCTTIMYKTITRPYSHLVLLYEATEQENGQILLGHYYTYF